MSDRVIFWDFDGTLAERPGLWSSCLLEVLDERMPGHGITRKAISVGLADGFPWHRYETPHPELCDPDVWWRTIGAVLVHALTNAGVPPTEAQAALPRFRSRYSDPAIGWRLFDDSLFALETTASAGWRNVILSNHIPELAMIVSGLGLDRYIDAVFSSALTGFEKPHPEAFRHALREMESPAVAFMVGDNQTADISGAEAIGLPAILVRRPGAARLRSDGLAGAVELILHPV